MQCPVHVRQVHRSRKAGPLVLLAVALLAGSVETARAAVIIGPTAKLTVSNTVYDIGIVTVRDATTGKVTYALGVDENGEILPWSLQTAEFSVLVDGVLDPDPSIAYGVVVTDLGAPTTFTFSFLLPIVPVAGPNVVQGSLVGGLTDASGNGVSLTPTAATVQQSFVADSVTSTPLTSMGVDVGLGVAFGAGSPGSLYGYGPFSAGPIVGPVGPPSWDTLVVTTAFTMSGSGDVAALTGFASITPGVLVPEPGTMISAAVGVGLLALLRIRRRRAA
jgi:hypothetical protein